MDRVDEILMGGDVGKQQTKPFTGDRVDQLLMGEGLQIVESPLLGEKGRQRYLQSSEEPTGEISAITTKQVTKPVSVKEKTASFGALLKSGFVDDPQTKINILAESRGISPERYGIVDGEIVYLADDGVLYYETRHNKLGKLKRGVAEQIPHLPELALSAALVPAGPGAVALGAAGGAGIRKSIGSLVFDEPQTSLKNIKDMAISAGTGYLGEKLGAGAVRGIDLSKGRKGARLIKAAGYGRKRIDPVQMKRIEDLGQKYGINLFSPQTTGSHELIARFNLLGDIPVTADKVGRAKLKQYAEINEAVGKWLKSFGPDTTTSGSAGRKAIELSKSKIKEMEKKATEEASPLYQKAFETAKPVQTKRIVKKIDNLLKESPEGSPLERLLTGIKRRFYRTVKDKDGKSKKVLESRLSVLDKVKKEIDDIVEKKSPDIQSITPSQQKDLFYNMDMIRRDLIMATDEASPLYKKARDKFASHMPSIEEMKKGKVGTLARLKGESEEKVASKILSPTQSSPEIVKKVRQVITKQGNKKAWDALIRVHAKKAFRDTVKTGTKNIGGQLRKRLFGDINQREIMKAAMTPIQYKNFDNFMEVLEKTGLTAGKESTTAPRLVSLTDMQEEALGLRGKALRAIAYPLFTWKRILVDFRARLKTEKYQNQLVDAMTSRIAAKQLQSMLRLKPGSQIQLKRLAVFLTSVSVGEYREAQARSKYPNIPLSTVLEQGKPQKDLRELLK